MRHLLIVLMAAALLSSLPSRARACSQCMCGTPFPSDVLGGVVPTQFTYGLEERYLSKANALDEGPGLEEEREHRMAAFALWRPVNNLALIGRVPYNVKAITTKPAGEASFEETSHGIGDAELLGMIGLFHTTSSRPLAVGMVVGGAAPTGSNDKKNAEGDRLDAHLQPGSGAWSGTAGLNTAMSSGSGVWDASILGRVNGTNAHGYRYGNAVLYNAGLTSKLWGSTQLLAQINGRVAQRDRLEDGTMGENTGGSVTYLSPGLRWSSGVGVAIEGAVQVPVAQSLYGVQKEHTTARLTLSMAH
jgi:hypothetical protein